MLVPPFFKFATVTDVTLGQRASISRLKTICLLGSAASISKLFQRQ